MSNWGDVATWVGLVAGWITAGYQRYQRGKADAELRAMQRRGEAPFLIPDNRPFSVAEFQGLEGNRFHLHASEQSLLCWYRRELDPTTHSKDTIGMVIQNAGRSAVCCAMESVDLPGLSCESSVESDEPPRLLLCYTYEPEKHGKPQRFKLKFEVSPSGFQDTHTYELIHGHHNLKRVDPPTP